MQTEATPLPAESEQQELMKCKEQLENARIVSSKLHAELEEVAREREREREANEKNREELKREAVERERYTIYLLY